MCTDMLQRDAHLDSALTTTHFGSKVLYTANVESGIAECDAGPLPQRHQTLLLLLVPPH